MLSDLESNSSDIVSAVINIVTKEVHIHIIIHIQGTREVLELTAKCSALDINIGEGTEICVYKSCQTGKDKYCRFQLEWYKQCSLLLKDQVDQRGQKELLQIHQRWLGYCEGSGIAKEVYNPVLIAVYSAVFDCLMLKVAKHKNKLMVIMTQVKVHHWKIKKKEYTTGLVELLSLQCCI
jgi:hypothetical protein